MRGEPVAIFGDYDVDGATSAALLHDVLAALGLVPRIYIPDRIFEGYGPNPEAIDTLAGEGARLIVCVDCGSTSFEALERARARGVDVDRARPPSGRARSCRRLSRSSIRTAATTSPAQGSLPPSA